MEKDIDKSGYKMNLPLNLPYLEIPEALRKKDLESHLESFIPSYEFGVALCKSIGIKCQYDDVWYPQKRETEIMFHQKSLKVVKTEGSFCGQSFGYSTETSYIKRDIIYPVKYKIKTFPVSGTRIKFGPEDFLLSVVYEFGQSNKKILKYINSSEKSQNVEKKWSNKTQELAAWYKLIISLPKPLKPKEYYEKLVRDIDEYSSRCPDLNYELTKRTVSLSLNCITTQIPIQGNRLSLDVRAQPEIEKNNPKEFENPDIESASGTYTGNEIALEGIALNFQGKKKLEEISTVLGQIYADVQEYREHQKAYEDDLSNKQSIKRVKEEIEIVEQTGSEKILRLEEELERLKNNLKGAKK